MFSYKTHSSEAHGQELQTIREAHIKGENQLLPTATQILQQLYVGVDVSTYHSKIPNNSMNRSWDTYDLLKLEFSIHFQWEK